MNREQTKDAISRAQPTYDSQGKLRSGTWVMYFHRGKVTRGAIGAPSKSGLLLGPARVIMTEEGSPTMEWIGAIHDRTNWCCLGVSWKQIDQMSSHSAPSMQ